MESFVVAHGLGSVVVALWLSCSSACGILVHLPGIEPWSPALQGGFLTTGPPGKSHQLEIMKFKYRSNISDENLPSELKCAASMKCTQDFEDLVRKKNVKYINNLNILGFRILKLHL